MPAPSESLFKDLEDGKVVTGGCLITENQPRWLCRVEPTVRKTWEGTGWAKKYWIENEKSISYDEAHGLSRSTD